jgi:hypothetical protein
MTRPLLRAAPALLLVFAVSACDQPKPRPAPEASASSPAADPSGTPAAPEWVASLVGRGAQEVFPKAGACKGNTDVVFRTYGGSPPGVQIHGWGWDPARKAGIERVILVDAENRIVGGGQGGAARPDVPAAVPEITDGNTGWIADGPVKAGPLGAYGVLSDDTTCVLGRVEF